MIFLLLFVALMGAGAVCTVFRGGENEGICNYDYIGEDDKK